MNAKERKRLKHHLKTTIDTADTFIQLGLSGIIVGAPEINETARTRKMIIEQLTAARETISKESNQFLAEIDDIIKKLS